LKSEQARVATYYRWSKNLDRVADLAGSGFFLTHPWGESSQCIYCKGYLTLTDLQKAGQDLFSYHEKRFPWCPFVKRENVGDVSWIHNAHTGYPPAQRIMAALQYMGEVQVDRATYCQRAISPQVRPDAGKLPDRIENMATPQINTRYKWYGNGLLPFPTIYQMLHRGQKQKARQYNQKPRPPKIRTIPLKRTRLIKIGTAILLPLMMMVFAQLITGAMGSTPGESVGAKVEGAEEVGTGLEFPLYNKESEVEMTGSVLEEPIYTDKGELAPGIYQLEPWKGIVAIKKIDIIVPENYATATWKFDVQACMEARDSINTALALVTAHLPGDAAAKQGPIARLNLIKNQMGELSDNHMIQGMKALTEPEIVMARQGNNAIMNSRECGILKAAAEAAATTRVQFSGDGGTAMVDITINALAEMSGRMKQIVQVFRETMLKADSNQMTPELYRLFSDTPSYLGKKCSAGEKPEKVLNNPALFTIIQGIDFSADDAENITGSVASYIHTQVPCLDWEQVYTKFELRAFPFGEKPKMLTMEPTEIWVNAQSGKIVDMQLMCRYYAPLPICSKLQGRSEEEPGISGEMPHEIHLATGTSKIEENAAMISEIRPSEYLIYSAQPTEGTLKCGNTKTAVTLQGLVHAIIKKACRLDIRSMQAKLMGNSPILEPIMPLVKRTFRTIMTIVGGKNNYRETPHDRERERGNEDNTAGQAIHRKLKAHTERGNPTKFSGFQTMDHMKEEENISSAWQGLLNARNETITRMQEHFHENWPIYVITATSVTGCATVCGGLMLLAKYCRGRATHRQRRKMYVRSGIR
jgi:hypothetical protein